MKNLFLLPTEKPSRLWINNLLQGKLELSKEVLKGSNTAQHIYITNDETIKEGDWFLDDDRLSKFSNNGKPIWVLRQCTHIRNGWIFYDKKESEGCIQFGLKKLS
jgi:hypothetical protein